MDPIKQPEVRGSNNAQSRTYTWEFGGPEFGGHLT